MITYNGRNSELVLLGVVEELQHVVTDNDTGFARENIFGTHACCFEMYGLGWELSVSLKKSVTWWRSRDFLDWCGEVLFVGPKQTLLTRLVGVGNFASPPKPTLLPAYARKDLQNNEE
jgi:hypothetical protein